MAIASHVKFDASVASRVQPRLKPHAHLDKAAIVCSADIASHLNGKTVIFTDHPGAALADTTHDPVGAELPLSPITGEGCLAHVIDQNFILSLCLGWQLTKGRYCQCTEGERTPCHHGRLYVW